jgi:hypothetical protein
MPDRYDQVASVENPSAPEGKAVKYARPERERRFLFRGRPSGDVVRTVDITDRYLRGTRIRLRETVERTAEDKRRLYKLTQKIPAPGGGPGLITTFYLDTSEYSAMSVVAADVLRKTRLSIPPLGVDIFHGPLEGLVLAEAEFDSDEDMQAFEPPDASLAEVTDDHRFTGGRLATVSGGPTPIGSSTFRG